MKGSIYDAQYLFWQNYPDKEFGQHMLEHMIEWGYKCILVFVITGHGDEDVDQ